MAGIGARLGRTPAVCRTACDRVAQSLTRPLTRLFPERRVFLRSDHETRYLRLGTATQAAAAAGCALIVVWAIVASAIVLMDSIGSGNARSQALRDRGLYEQRLEQLSQARDARAAEALRAQARFHDALDQISEMQTALLAAQERRKELEQGIEVMQLALRNAVEARDEARDEAQALAARLDGVGSADDPEVQLASYQEALEVLSGTLSEIAGQRDTMADSAREAEAEAQRLVLEARLVAERNDRIFDQLEQAVSVSIEPLGGLFKKAGMDSEKILATVRRGYSGHGGPLTPVTLSTRGRVDDGVTERANTILERLDDMNLYRIAIEKAPFGQPLKSAYRLSSGFGSRWGRMHQGMDMAGAYGAPIYATGNGVVKHAGWMSGYGNLVEIQHDFGLVTRYGHMSKIRVSVGQRVSRGDQIGDIGSTGRSTGNHLHYEVRVGGKPVNPVTYLRAEKDVF